MDDHNSNGVREVRHDFKGAEAWPVPLVPQAGAKPLRVKVFKSGNSLALRLPAVLGLEAGMEMDLTTQPDGSYVLRRAEPAQRGIDISGFWGKAKGLRVPERRDFDERPSTIAARLARGEG